MECKISASAPYKFQNYFCIKFSLQWNHSQYQNLWYWHSYSYKLYNLTDHITLTVLVGTSFFPLLNELTRNSRAVSYLTLFHSTLIIGDDPLYSRPFTLKRASDKQKRRTFTWLMVWPWFGWGLLNLAVFAYLKVTGVWQTHTPMV